MSPNQRHIIFNNTNYEESHAISKPTITAFIPTKIMETNAEKRVYDKRVRLYMLNQNWLKIRKQKDRRRRRVLARIFRASQLAMLKRMYNQTI